MPTDTDSLEIAAPDRDAALRADVIQFFVNLASALGLPKSVGEIFGALYCSRNPLSFNELIERSGTSKASVSQGLRTLKNINAICAVNVASDRRTYYRAELRIANLLEGFLRETIEPQLRRGAAHIAHLQTSPTDDAFLKQRIDGLREWNRNTAKLLMSLDHRE